MQKLDQLIKAQHNAIATEGFDSVREYVQRFHDIRLYDSLKKRMHSIFQSKSFHGRINPTVHKKVTKWLLDVGYPNLSNFTVYVPVGLTSPVNEYLNILEANNEYFNGINEGLIVPTINLFSLLLSQPELLISASPVADSLTQAPLLQHKVEELNAPLAKCFDVKSPSDQLFFTKAYARVADLDDAARRVSTLQDTIGRESPMKVRDNCEKLFDIASALSKELKTNPQYAEVSKKISEQLADRLYICARWIEAYGVHLDQIQTLAVAITDTEAKIKKIA